MADGEKAFQQKLSASWIGLAPLCFFSVVIVFLFFITVIWTSFAMPVRLPYSWLSQPVPSITSRSRLQIYHQSPQIDLVENLWHFVNINNHVPVNYNFQLDMNAPKSKQNRFNTSFYLRPPSIDNNAINSLGTRSTHCCNKVICQI